MAQSETNIRSKIANGVVVLGRNILVKPDSTAEFHGRIAVPENVRKEYPTSGRVVKLGMELVEGIPDKNNAVYLTPIRVGDRVVFSKYSGIECHFEDELMVTLKVEDVLLIIDANLN